MEGGDSGKVWVIKPMQYRGSFRTLDREYGGQSELYGSLWKKMCSTKLEMATRLSSGEMDGLIKFLLVSYCQIFIQSATILKPEYMNAGQLKAGTCLSGDY